MRNFTRSTGSKPFDYYCRGYSQVIQLPTILKSRTGVTGSLRPGVKYYMQPNNVIGANTTVGIEYFPAEDRNAPILSGIYPYPVEAITVGALGLDIYLTVTLCDANGVILFNRVPVPELIATLRKVKAYTGKICTQKSYFQLTNSPVIPTPDPIVVNLAFYLR